MQVKPLSIPQQIETMDLPTKSRFGTESIQRTLPSSKAMEELEIPEMVLDPSQFKWQKGRNGTFCAACPQDGFNLPPGWEAEQAVNPWVIMKVLGAPDD